MFKFEGQLKEALSCAFPSWKFVLAKLKGAHSAPESPGLSQLDFSVFPVCVKLNADNTIEESAWSIYE